jgi:hypothetical protein
VTDAHCHPTDLDYGTDDYDGVQLGAVAAMATDVENQSKVEALGEARGWRQGCISSSESRQQRQGKGTSVISCFGMSQPTVGTDSRVSPMVCPSIHPDTCHQQRRALPLPILYPQILVYLERPHPPCFPPALPPRSHPFRALTRAAAHRHHLFPRTRQPHHAGRSRHRRAGAYAMADTSCRTGHVRGNVWHAKGQAGRGR